ncbi:PRC-barrel domain-containing protein [Streptomonospora sp. S1-112]|uniref:PRC-barrel domain-containing protein n=1 Tax=Streptomonospora mangrovi TaxID=2883123 RepID=A0A9X3NR12_9ACTN|nr:PRC-barrel domain-containing protein [Streptomonospora mangrovi]MDA0566808.1 PRC-barrel domain-containing protein [Streptomonospora mangrovi]
MPTILVSDLLGREVRDSRGTALGRVQDVVVRRTADGGYEVVGLVTGRSSVAGRWGYGGSLAPPPLLRAVLRRLRAHERYLRWDHIAELGETVRTSVPGERLGRRWSDVDPA